MPASFMTLLLEDARVVADAAVKEASRLQVMATVIVLDAAGNPVHLVRMDGAWPGAFPLALGKANVAHAFQAPSGSFTPLVQPGAPLFGVGSVSGGEFLPLPGGEPIRVGSAVIGAIGVSGGTPDQDEMIARAGVVALEDR